MERTPHNDPAAAVKACPLVFVYGTLKRGRGNHYRLTGAEFIGPAETRGRHRLFVSGLPFLVEGTRENPGKHRVKGELYHVDADTMAGLDRLEGHPHFYERRLVRVTPGGAGHNDGATVVAWVYFHPWAPHFAGLTPVAEF